MKLVILVEVDEVFINDGKNAEILNLLFSKAVENLKLGKFKATDPLTDTVSQQRL